MTDSEAQRLQSALKALGHYPWSEEETAKFENGTTFLATYDIGHQDIQGNWVEMIGETVQVMVTDKGWVDISGNFPDYYTIIPTSIIKITPPIPE